MDILLYDGTSSIPVKINFTNNYYDTICIDVNPALGNFTATMYQDITLRKPNYVTRVYSYPLVTGVTVSNNPYTNLSLFLLPLDNSTTIT